MRAMMGSRVVIVVGIVRPDAVDIWASTIVGAVICGSCWSIVCCVSVVWIRVRGASFKEIVILGLRVECVIIWVRIEANYSFLLSQTFVSRCDWSIWKEIVYIETVSSSVGGVASCALSVKIWIWVTRNWDIVIFWIIEHVVVWNIELWLVAI